MEYPLQMSLWFVIGLFFEAFVLVGRQFNKAIVFIMAFCAGIALLVNLLMSFKGVSVFVEDGFVAHVIVFSAVFSVSFGYILKNQILPPINERYLIIWNLLFLYVYLQRINDIGIFSWIIFVLSLLTILNAFLKFRLMNFWKVFFYAWFLFMIVYFAIAQFAFSNFVFLATTEPIKGINGITAILTGMAFFYIIIHVWYLFRLIPIPLNRTTTFRERINEWREDTKLMASKYLDDYSSNAKILVILLILGGTLFINYKMSLLPDWLLINACIVLIPFFLSKQDKVAIQN